MIDEIKWLKERRTALKLTLRQVEEATKISNSYLSQLESGKIKKPSFQTIKTLTDYYNGFKVEPDKVKCPCCRSENVKEAKLTKDNGIIGSGYRSWVYFSYWVCDDCGVMFKSKIDK